MNIVSKEVLCDGVVWVMAGIRPVMRWAVGSVVGARCDVACWRLELVLALYAWSATAPSPANTHTSSDHPRKLCLQTPCYGVGEAGGFYCGRVYSPLACTRPSTAASQPYDPSYLPTHSV